MIDRRTGVEYACKTLPKVRGRLTAAKTGASRVVRVFIHVIVQLEQTRSPRRGLSGLSLTFALCHVRKLLHLQGLCPAGNVWGPIGRFEFQSLKNFVWAMRAAKKIWAEVDIHARVSQSSAVAALHSVYEDDANVYIIQEMCHGGDLDKLLRVSLHRSVLASSHTVAWAME